MYIVSQSFIHKYLDTHISLHPYMYNTKTDYNLWKVEDKQNILKEPSLQIHFMLFGDTCGDKRYVQLEIRTLSLA